MLEDLSARGTDFSNMSKIHLPEKSLRASRYFGKSLKSGPRIVRSPYLVADSSTFSRSWQQKVTGVEIRLDPSDRSEGNNERWETNTGRPDGSRGMTWEILADLGLGPDDLREKGLFPGGRP